MRYGSVNILERAETEKKNNISSIIYSGMAMRRSSKLETLLTESCRWTGTASFDKLLGDSMVFKVGLSEASLLGSDLKEVGLEKDHRKAIEDLR